MRRVALLVMATAIVAMIPVGAQASHCDSPIYIFSRTSYPGGPYPDPRGGQLRFLPSAVSSVVGCTVVHDTLKPDDPHEATDSDIIYPGSDSLSVRLLAHTDGSAITSATLEFAGTTYALTLTNTVTITGGAATFLDSQNISVDPTKTLAANAAVATICVQDEGCYTRTYRTVA